MTIRILHVRNYKPVHCPECGDTDPIEKTGAVPYGIGKWYCAMCEVEWSQTVPEPRTED